MKQALEALEFDGFTPENVTHRHLHNKAITALRTAIAEAEKQEPYGYFRYDMRLDAWVQSRDSNKGVAFYTIPPAAQRDWVGLTDEEILSDETMRYYYGMNGGAGPVSQKGKKVVAAIEAKLKEKNR